MIVYENKRGSGWKEVGRTEIYENKHNPDFKARIKIDYYFERTQELKFAVYDWDNYKSKAVQYQDFIGQCVTTLANVVVDSGMPRPLLKLSGKQACKRRAVIVINSEQQSDNTEMTFMQLSGIKLPKMDWGLFAKSDPYVQVFRQAGNTWVKVHQTETILKTLDPRWKPFTLSVRQLCNGDYNKPVLFKVFDFDKVGSDDLIGEFTATVADLKQARRFPLRRKGKRKTYGHIEFTEYQKFTEAGFVDFVQGGMDIDVMVAVDYTGSNGNPSSRTSLHYQGSGLSPYANAISRVLGVLGPYDRNQRIPVYGFGGKVLGKGVSHCFALNFDESNPECKGAQGVLDAYHQSFKRVLLSGPTYFSEILQMAYVRGLNSRFDATRQQYTILVILTDGVIDDMRQSIAHIVNMSDLPISIIIVGVGDADFTNMNRLDGDDEVLESNGKKCDRDIVQFVPMRAYQNDMMGLTDATLAEIPAQVLQFAKKKKVEPMAPRERKWDAKTAMGDAVTGTVVGAAAPVAATRAPAAGGAWFQSGPASAAAQTVSVQPVAVAQAAPAVPPSRQQGLPTAQPPPGWFGAGAGGGAQQMTQQNAQLQAQLLAQQQQLQAQLAALRAQQQQVQAQVQGQAMAAPAPSAATTQAGAAWFAAPPPDDGQYYAPPPPPQ